MNRHLLALLVCIAMVTGLRADDWPQWRGPNRDGRSQEKGLARRWPGTGPQKLWSINGLGEGFSTVAVVGDRIFTTGMVDGQGKLFLISTAGKLLGAKTYGPETKGGGYPGPRSTPTVAGDRVYVLSGEGLLVCFKLNDGQVVWQKDLFRDLGGRQIQWSVTESVLVDGDRVYCTPGGSDATVAALDARNGREIWRSRLGGKSAHCSPLLVDHNGRRILLTMAEEGAIAVDAKDGRDLWLHPYKNRYAVHASTPVYLEGMVVISSGYNQGSEGLQMNQAGTAVRKLWENKDLSNHHGGIIRLDDAVVGTGERDLICLDIATGRVKWRDPAVGKGSIVFADGLLYMYSERGEVGLAEVSAKSFGGLTGKFRVTEGSKQHWAHPVVANGVLYIRHGDTLIAYKAGE